MRVVVLGAGVAGLGAALALGRRGCDVMVLERDATEPPASPAEAFGAWDRSGVGHFRQPHNFLALGRRTLLDHAPDVVERLTAARADTVDQAALLPPAERRPEDAELATIACRRPVFEAVLRAAATECPQVRVAGGVVVAGLRAERRGTDVVVTGVRTAAGTIDADLVVDAGGRTSRLPEWLEAAGAELPPHRRSDCGLVYFSRHFRFRPGAGPPERPYILGGPRGDLGYLAFAIFLGDAGTFCLVMMTLPGDADLRPLRDERAFAAAAALLPGVAEWVGDDVAEPLGPVQFMGRLSNSYRPLHGTGVRIRGVQSIGDAYTHTNPTFAFGASLALAHGFSLAALVDRHGVGEAPPAFEAAHGPDASARFEAVGAEDRDRVRWWSGEPLDPFDPVDSLPLALRFAVYPAAARDAEVFRAVARRIGALDPVDRLASSGDLVERALRLHRRMLAEGAVAPPGRPPRDEMAAAVARAVRAGSGQQRRERQAM